MAHDAESGLPARRRGGDPIRRSRHAATGARLELKLAEVTELAEEAGLGPEAVAERLAALRGAVAEGKPPMNWRRFGLWLLGVVAVAAVAAVWAWPTGQTHPLEHPMPAVAADVAELVVALHLGEHDGEGRHPIDAYLARPPASASPGGHYVQNTWVVGWEDVDWGWRITVAAQVLDRVQGGYSGPAVERFAVEIGSDRPYLARSLPKPIG